MKSVEISQKILDSLGIENINAMQIAAYQNISEKNSVILSAPTGSGKTLAFLLPIIDKLNSSDKNIQCLILTPSRELAIQIEQVWRKMATGFKLTNCYGGHSTQIEIRSLTESPALLIGTPGRIKDHILRESIELKETKILVLDEFDKSLSMGFEEEMTFIIEHLPKIEKRILVSATSNIKIPEFVGMQNPKVLDFNQTEEKTTDGLVLKTIITRSKDKTEDLIQLLCYLGNESTLIFCNLRETTEQLCARLQNLGLDAAFFHGKMEQIDREKTLVAFRNGTTTFLVSSDLAARGLDIPAVKNVIHFEMPLNLKDFVHRNGRTARMNAQGTAYLLMSQGEERPFYLDIRPQEFKIPENRSLPQASEWKTLYISGGKKNKLSKMDIVGFLSKKGNLEKNDVGLIEIMDYMSFAAVKKIKIAGLMPLIRSEKMKGQKYKIEEARVTNPIE